MKESTSPVIASLQSPTHAPVAQSSYARLLLVVRALQVSRRC